MERFQQTLKKWLRAQADQPSTLAELQALLEAFAEVLNHSRPHRSLPHRATPATAYTRPPQGHPRPGGPQPTTPTTGSATTGSSKSGTVTLRIAGRLHHIGIGRTHAGTYVILLVQDLNVRVVHAATGELLRDLVIDPTPRLPTHRTTTPTHPEMTPAGPTTRRSGLSPMS